MINNTNINIYILLAELQMGLESCRSNNWHCKDESCAIAARLSINEFVTSLKMSAIPLDQLIYHVVEAHLKSIKYTLPQVSEFFMREQLSNTNSTAAIARAENLVTEFEQVLKKHMLAEETMLFPYIIVMEEAAKEDRAVPLPAFESLTSFVDQLNSEHKTLSTILSQIREAYNEIQVTDDASNGFINLGIVIATLEREMQAHIHLEENFIFPIAEYLATNSHNSPTGDCKITPCLAQHDKKVDCPYIMQEPEHYCNAPAAVRASRCLTF